MKVLVVGPSDTKSRGGMATVIGGIRSSKELNQKYEITIFPSYIDGNFPVRLAYSLAAYLRFLTIYRKYELFHIHTACFGSTFRKRIYLNTVKRAGKKAIVHIHGAEYMVFYAGLTPKKKKKVRDFLQSADMVIALSQSWKKKFQSVFELDNCVVLPNGIDTEEFLEGVCEPEIHRNEFVFLGRMGERKGAYDLVEAVGIAVRTNPDIRVYMAGDGEVEKVRSLVQEKKLQNHIEVHGWVDFKGKLGLLKEAATLVLPSYHEGLPMAILEGMAAGKAVISTKVGAIPEVVKEENGILIRSGDIQALAEALVRCSSDVNMLKTMSGNNRKKIEETFSMKIMHRQLMTYYDEAAGKK